LFIDSAFDATNVLATNSGIVVLSLFPKYHNSGYAIDLKTVEFPAKHNFITVHSVNIAHLLRV